MGAKLAENTTAWRMANPRDQFSAVSVAWGTSVLYRSAFGEPTRGAALMSHAMSIKSRTLLLPAAIGVAFCHAASAASDLNRAYRTIAAKRFVDLTHSFAPDTPVWSGFGQARMMPAADPKTHEPYTIPKDGFRTTFYELVGQYGTHVDPPAHFAENGVTMDNIPVKQMIQPLVVLDDARFLAKDPNHAFSVADLMAWEKAHGRVPKGAFAALRTDMYKDWDTNPERFKRSEFPAWSLETVKFLVEKRGVTAIGHESMDTDTTEKMESETYMLQQGHFPIEVLANLA